MLRPAPSVPALRALRSHLFPDSFPCASRSLQSQSRLKATHNDIPDNAFPRSRPAQQPHRTISVATPVTSVNASRRAPPANQGLHDALSAVEKDAASHVSLSQLSLALRGLEVADPVTRVAVRQWGGGARVKELVRLLLADPLVPEQEWEKQLVADDGDGRSLLIRYGEAMDFDAQNPLVRVFTMPSIMLQTHRLEVLLLNRREEITGESHVGGASSLVELLVPSMETPTSATGRQSMIAYPVHKTIVLSSGMGGIRHLPASFALPHPTATPLVKAAIDLPYPAADQGLASEGISIVNLSQGEQALAELRQSTRNSTEFEHDWLDSKLGDLSAFVTDRTAFAPPSNLKPAHRTLILSILSDASESIAADESRVAALVPRADNSALVREELSEVVSKWSESAHTELRNELSNAFGSRIWRKLAWWKLMWRVDDVNMYGTDLLTRFYLNDAEKGIIWVEGRMAQSGMLNMPGRGRVRSGQIGPDPNRNKAAIRPKAKGIPRVPTEVPDRETPALYFHPTRPWSYLIASSRASLLSETLPALQARAQSLLLQALLGSTLSSAIGGLAYVMVSTTGVYEAGSVAALGIVVSIGRLQRTWEGAKKSFVADVEVMGQKVLRLVEEGARYAVRQVEKEQSRDFEGAEDRAKAKTVVERARDALHEMDGKKE